jgi:hypothetical protein
MDTQQVLDKYFKDGKTLFFHQSDRHHSIEGDTYLKFEKNGGIELWLGGDNGLCAYYSQEMARYWKKLFY